MGRLVLALSDLGLVHASARRVVAVNRHERAKAWLESRVRYTAGDLASLRLLLDEVREETLKDVSVALYEQTPTTADEAIDIVQKLAREG